MAIFKRSMAVFRRRRAIFRRRRAVEPSKPEPEEPETETPKASILCERPYAIPLLVSLCVLVIWNTVMTVLAAVATAALLSIYWDQYTRRIGADYYGSVAAFWLLIPVVTLSISVVDLYMRWRKTLTPLRMVVSASFGLVIWIVALGVWFPCTAARDIFSTALGPSNAPYCPWYLYPGFQFQRSVVLPYVGIGCVVLYAAHLVLGLIMTIFPRREAATGDAKFSALEANIRRMQMTSDIFTTVDWRSDSLPSTIQGYAVSPPATARAPPSYRMHVHSNDDVRSRPSSFYSSSLLSHGADGDHSMYPLSRICTCQCHRHLSTLADDRMDVIEAQSTTSGNVTPAPSGNAAPAPSGTAVPVLSETIERETSETHLPGT